MLILIVAVLIAAGTEWAARRDGADAAQHAQSPDSLTRSSAAYHGSRADATVAARWTWAGHGTLGIIFGVVGACLMYSGRRRAS
jgi:hypothetical protein